MTCERALILIYPTSLEFFNFVRCAVSSYRLIIVGAADVLPYVDADLKKIAARVVEKAKELCLSKSVFMIIVALMVNFLIFSCV